MPLHPTMIRAKLKALDAVDAMLDDRDAENADRLKRFGVAPTKGSDTALDGDGIGRKDPPSDSETKHTRDSTQDGEHFVEHPEGESQDDNQDHGNESVEDDGHDDGLVSELKKMASSNSNAKNALAMLEDDEDEEEREDTVPPKGKRRDSSKV